MMNKELRDTIKMLIKNGYSEEYIMSYAWGKRDIYTSIDDIEITIEQLKEEINQMKKNDERR